MPDLRLVPTAELTPLERLGRDFLAAGRARGLSPKTLDQVYRPRLERIFLPWAKAEGIEDVAQIDKRALDRFSGQLLEGGNLKPASVSSYVRSINAFLNWARAEGERIAATARLSVPKQPERVVETLTTAEVEAMERVASGRDALIVRVLAETGIRVGELVGLRPADVVERDRKEYLLVTGKGSKERLVPITPRLARRLRGYARSRPADASSDKLLLGIRRSSAGTYEPLTTSGVEQLIRALARQAGIARRVHPHMFRHTYATEMLRGGMDSTKLRRVLGHSSTVLIDRTYSHVRTEDMHDEVVRLLERK